MVWRGWQQAINNLKLFTSEYCKRVFSEKEFYRNAPAIGPAQCDK